MTNLLAVLGLSGVLMAMWAVSVLVWLILAVVYGEVRIVRDVSFKRNVGLLLELEGKAEFIKLEGVK